MSKRQKMNASNQKLKAQRVDTRLIELIVMMSDEEKQSLVEELEERLQIKKRRHERKPYFSTVCYTTRDGAHVDFIQNISAGGVFIGTRLHPPVGEKVTLAFPLPMSQEHIMLDGEIVWATQQGMGVKFQISKPEEEERICDLVDMI
jgi:Tfp pilus assembly protein PilZ